MNIEHTSMTPVEAFQKSEELIAKIITDLQEKHPYLLQKFLTLIEDNRSDTLAWETLKDDKREYQLRLVALMIGFQIAQVLVSAAPEISTDTKQLATSLAFLIPSILWLIQTTDSLSVQKTLLQRKVSSQERRLQDMIDSFMERVAPDLDEDDAEYLAERLYTNRIFFLMTYENYISQRDSLRDFSQEN